jgi:predicted nucleotidyltransferase
MNSAKNSPHLSLGLTPDEWTFLQTHLVQRLIQAGATVCAFGSRARGQHQPYSDIDIMVEHPSVDLSQLLAEIREFFENSNFRYKLDLVDKRHFAHDYLENFEREKVRLLGD